MRKREGERERHTPRSAEHDTPLLYAQVLTQRLAVGHQIGRVVVLQLAAWRRATAATLIE